jgi:putative phage-type endonuclease
MSAPYTVNGLTYGETPLKKTQAAAAWEWVKCPTDQGTSRVESGGRLLFRLPGDFKAAVIWRKCCVDVLSGHLGLKIGRPLDVEFGQSEMPMLVYVKDAHDTLNIRCILAQVILNGGGGSENSPPILKDANGIIVDIENEDGAPNAKRHCSTLHAIDGGGAVLDPSDLGDIDWSSLLTGRHSAKDILVSPPKDALVAENSTTVADTLLAHHSITLAYILSLKKEIEEKERVLDFPCKLKSDPDINASEFYRRFAARTPQECAIELAAPQRSNAWLRARSLSITASDFGGAVGHNSFSSPEEVIERKLWDTFHGNDATAWGSYCEDLAAESFVAWMRKILPCSTVTLHQENLMKSASAPWMAVSPDGLLECVDASGQRTIDLVEFKCPVRDARRGGSGAHPYSHYSGNVPPYYMDQVQGISGYVNTYLGGYRGLPLRGIWFVVWRPLRMWVTRVPIDAAYYLNLLLPALEKFYFGKLLPAFAHKYNGRIRKGEIVPPVNIY